MSCSESVLDSTEMIQTERNEITKRTPLSEHGLKKFSGFKDRENYPQLEDLAYVLATRQHEYSQIMIRSMKKSKVKEGILNLTKGNDVDVTNDLILDVKNKIEIVYEKNGKLKSKKIKIKQLLKRLSSDVNIYFPIVEHRKNVLLNGETFWVAFNPPDHDTTEYFVRAFNQFGEDSLISSKNSPTENVLILAYSEKQESLSPALMKIAPIDCIEGDLYGEPCLPIDPTPDPTPTPITYEKGLNITSIRTKGYDDGWLDGELELYFFLDQPAFSGYIDIPILGSSPFNFNVSTFMEAEINHNAGHWGGVFGQIWRESNKTTLINARRRASERYLLADVPLVGKFYYDEFKIRIEEWDALSANDIMLIGTNFNLNTQTFGREVNIKNNRIWIQFDYKDYPSNTF